MEFVVEEKQEDQSVKHKREITSFTYHSPDRKYSICGFIHKPTNTLKIGIALKNDKDNFSRRLGHKIALGRAMKNPVGIIELDGEKPAKAFYGYAKIYASLIEHIVNNTVHDVLRTLKKQSHI